MFACARINLSPERIVSHHIFILFNSHRLKIFYHRSLKKKSGISDFSKMSAFSQTGYSPVKGNVCDAEKTESRKFGFKYEGFDLKRNVVSSNPTNL